MMADTSSFGIPDCLNKSADELYKYKKQELISMILETNTFIITRLLEQNSMLKDRLAVLDRVCSIQTDVINKQQDKIIKIETQVNLNDQYSRELNVEFSGIPKEVKQDELEETVLELCEQIGVTVPPNSIQACHRLFLKESDQGIPRTIVRFLGKKTSGEILRKRKKLKDIDVSLLNFPTGTKVYANDNLCPYFRKLLGIATHLRNDNFIYSCWTFKGLVFIKKSEDSDPLQISHISTLKNHFPEVGYIDI